MRAVTITRFGGPEVLEVREVPVPDPGPGQVAIDVAYAGVNFTDSMARRGQYRPADPPFVLGLEVSGRVRALGDGVEGFRVGQPVAALTLSGGYAEVALAPAAMTYPLGGLDGAVDLPTAAALPTVVPTAYAILAEAARLVEGETVLIHAAAGGLGTVSAQVARQLGAGTVIGTVGGPEKASYAEGFGYDLVVTREGFARKVREATGDRGADVILENIGGGVRAESFDALAPFGRLVVCGNAGGEDEALPVTGADLRGYNAGVAGFSISAFAEQLPGRLADLSLRAFDLVASGKVRVDVTDVLLMEEAFEAHRRMDARSVLGKLVLRVDG